MEILSVPFVSQLRYHCGPAALEMVYRYLGLNDISQTEIFQKTTKHTDSFGNQFILVKDLVIDAQERGFGSFAIDFTNSSPQEIISVVKSFLAHKIPIISCGQWKKDRNIGHFRVILKVDDVHVYFHDPDLPSKTGYTKYTHDSFLGYWKSRAQLIGNMGLIIYRKEDTLPPALSNHTMKEML
jgi:hypothetical protein